MRNLNPREIHLHPETLSYARRIGPWVPGAFNLIASGTTFQKKVPLKVLEQGCPFPVNFTRKCYAFDHLFELANFATFTPEQYEEYQQHENMKYDYQNCLDYQYSKGRKEGLKEGMEKGRSKGIMERNIEIAKTCIEMGMDIPMISTITKLSEEEILKLK